VDEETKHELQAIWLLLRGNGEPGFLERVRLLEANVELMNTQMKTIQKSLDSIEEQRAIQIAEWKGFQRAFTWLIGILTFLIGGGYAAIIATLRTMLGGTP